ncbi:MAG TPA: hypothetical protein PLZ08_09410 [Bacillota bacterium]|nr:hypothetical protein [Bacillota bacterium]HOL10454.1 hypothetical protein [Bacillota bacterium]HPO98155.1 hypothetical protein [Bacillota bacterium]
MNFKKIYFLIIVLVVALSVLTWSIIKRNQPGQITSTIETKIDYSLPPPQTDRIEIQTTIGEAGQSDDLIQLSKRSSGRIDPFKKLAVELSLTLQSVTSQNESKPIFPKIPAVPLLGRNEQQQFGVIKGIFYGDQPAVLIETRDGAYRKFRIGDVLTVGTIVNIDLESVSIRDDDGRITKLKLGEEL